MKYKKKEKYLKRKAQRELKKEAQRKKIKKAMEISPEKEALYTQAITSLSILQEVMMYYGNILRDHPILKFKVKSIFQKFLEEGDKVNDHLRHLVQTDDRYEKGEGEELYEIDAERIFNLLQATYRLKTNEQWVEAISLIENIK